MCTTAQMFVLASKLFCCAESNQEAMHIQEAMLLPAWHSVLLYRHADEHGTSQVTQECWQT